MNHATEIADMLKAPPATPIPSDHNHAMALGHTIGAIAYIVRPASYHDDAAMVQMVRDAIAELRKWENDNV